METGKLKKRHIHFIVMATAYWIVAECSLKINNCPLSFLCEKEDVYLIVLFLWLEIAMAGQQRVRPHLLQLHVADGRLHPHHAQQGPEPRLRHHPVVQPAGDHVLPRDIHTRQGEAQHCPVGRAPHQTAG